MAVRNIVFRAARSIAGVALIIFGIFILYQNVAETIAELTRVLGANGSAALGVVPAIVLALAKLLQSHASGHGRFVRDLLQFTLLPSWPLLLVRVGTALSRDAFINN